MPDSIANETFTAVATQSDLACAINAASLVRCWGSHDYTPPADVANAPVVAMSTGSYHACVITAAGPVRCWGNDKKNATAVPPELANGSVAAASISCGDENCCAITKSGAALCWGDYYANQTDVPADLGSVSLICSASYHTCAVTESKTVRCWGANSDGRLVAPQALAGKAISSISCGSSHACALAGGAVYCWGSNYSAESAPPADLGAVVAVSAGIGYTCAILASGAVRCWGKSQPDMMPFATRPKDLDSIVHTYIDSYIEMCYILSPSGGELLATTRGFCVGAATA